MLLDVDSFDYYTTLTRRFSTVNGSAAVNSTAGRFGSNGLNLTTHGQRCVVSNAFVSGDSNCIFGFAYGVTSIGGTSRPIFSVQDASGNTQFSIAISAAGILTFFRGMAATSLGSTTSAIADFGGTMVYIEGKVLIDGSAGTVVIKVNGVTVLNLTGQNTKGSASSALFNGYTWGTNANNFENCNQRVDDFYLFDGTGGVNNDFIGDCRIEAILPNGAGSAADWTPSAGSNYQNVDENPSNEDTDYNSSSTVGQKDLFAMGALSSTTGTVKGIVGRVRHRKDDAGTRTVKFKCKSGTTEGDGADTLVNSTYAYTRDPFDTNPDTSAAWTPSEVNGMEAGYEVVA